MKRILLYLVVFLAVAVLPIPAIAQSLTWHTDQLIAIDAGSPRVAISGNNAVAVWTHDDGSHYRILASYSINKGATWSTPGIIDYNVLNAQEPQVAIDGSKVVVVFRQMEGGWQRIFANYSTDGGATWGGAQLIEDNAGNNGYEPQVAISGSNVVAVWRQLYGASDRIYANRSADGGATWGTDAIIDSSSNAAWQPHLAMSGNNVVAIWSQFDGSQWSIWSRYSNNGGASWAGTEGQSVENTNMAGNYPQIAISGNNVVAVWVAWDSVNSLGRIYVNRTAFSGSSGGTLAWTAGNAQRIDTSYPFEGDAPQIAISGNNVVAVWVGYEDATGAYRVYKAYSTNAGASWSADTLLQTADVDAGSPQVAVSGSNVVALWSQDNRIYARHSFNGGSSWSIPGLIEDNTGLGAGSPQVVVSGDNVVAVWIQNDNIYANYAILTAAATKDGGSNCFIATAAFGSPLVRQVEILRQFRDKYLLTNALGRKFVSWYYENGPVAASFIDDKPLLKAAVRATLYPLIGFSFLLINGFMPFLLMGLLGLAAILFFQFRPKKLNAR